MVSLSFEANMLVCAIDKFWGVIDTFEILYLSMNDGITCSYVVFFALSWERLLLILQNNEQNSCTYLDFSLFDPSLICLLLLHLIRDLNKSWSSIEKVPFITFSCITSSFWVGWSSFGFANFSSFSKVWMWDLLI